MSKFKVGDRVRVKRNLVAHTTYEYITLYHPMDTHLDVSSYIGRVTDGGNYVLQGVPYYWSGEMLELVETQDNPEASRQAMERAEKREEQLPRMHTDYEKEALKDTYTLAEVHDMHRELIKLRAVVKK